MAYMLFTPEQIAINIEVDEIDFLLEIETTSPSRTAFNRGLIRQEMELRTQIIKSAKNGSNPAQEQILKLLNTLKSSLNG